MELLGKSIKGRMEIKKKQIVSKMAPGIVMKELNKALADPEDDPNYKPPKGEADLENQEGKSSGKKFGKGKIIAKVFKNKSQPDANDEGLD